MKRSRVQQWAVGVGATARTGGAAESDEQGALEQMEQFVMLVSADGVLQDTEWDDELDLTESDILDFYYHLVSRVDMIDHIMHEQLPLPHANYLMHRIRALLRELRPA